MAKKFAAIESACANIGILNYFVYINIYIPKIWARQASFLIFFKLIQHVKGIQTL
jgi:hypothetical protein